MHDEAGTAQAAAFKLIELDALLRGIETGWSPACDAQPPASDEWGVVRVSAVTSGSFDPQESKRLPSDLVPRPGLEIRPGDVLLARANGARSLVGAVCHVKNTRPRLMLSDKTMRLVPDETLADAAFIALVLSAPSTRRQIGVLLNGSSGQNNISQHDVRRLLVPDIPLGEQRSIVAAHEAIERRIGALESTEVKFRAARNAFAEAAVAPGRDNLMALGEVVQAIETGWSPACDAVSPAIDEWGVVRVSAVTSGEFKPAEAKRLPAVAAPRPWLEIRRGDVLLARANGARSLVGTVCHVRETRAKLMLSDKIMRLVPDAKLVDAAYLTLVLSTQSTRRQIGVLLNGSSGQNNISQSDVRGLLIPVVPLEEQRRIVAAQDAGELRMGALKQQIEKLRTVQLGLTEDLLTGRVRAERRRQYRPPTATPARTSARKAESVALRTLTTRSG